MNIVIIASDTIWKDTPANIVMHETHVKKVMKRWPKTQVILFPEMSLSGFVVDDSNREIAETLEERILPAMGEIAQNNNVAIIAGFAEKNPDGGSPFNTAFVVDRHGELIAKYQKNHLFTESDEAKGITPGTTLTTFDLDGWKCGLSICFDIRFPRLFETYKKAGVEVVFSGFNWLKGRNKPDIMTNLVKARAHENQCFFAAVDRTGADPNSSYYGTSVISNPYCEDNSEQHDIYSYAELNKKDIESLSTLLPLNGSRKASYQIN